MAAAQEQVVGFEGLVARLAEAVAVAEHRRWLWENNAKALRATAGELLRELGCTELAVDGVVFRLVRTPAGRPDEQCVFYAETEQGLTPEEAKARCTEHEENIEISGLERLNASQLGQLNDALQLVAKAARLLRGAEDLARFMDAQDMVLARRVKEMLDEFKARHCSFQFYTRRRG